MFADLELIGIPHRITIGDRGPEGRQGRVPGRGATRRPPTVPVADIAAFIRQASLTAMTQ